MPEVRSPSRRRPSRAQSPSILPATDPQALLDFALSHMRITSFMGSRQSTLSNAYRLPERTLSDYNLIYVLDGAAEWTVAGSVHALAAQDLIVVPPGRPHAGRSCSRRMTLGSIHVLAELPGGSDVFPLFAVPRQRRVEPGCRLDQLLRAATEEYVPGYAHAAPMIPAWTELIIRQLLRHDASHGLLTIAGSDLLVVETLRLLERQLDRPLTLADLATRSGYSAQHLNRRFHRALGSTPLAILAGMRMERAASLLREGRWSVQAIGRRVGFADPGYFSRVFRARYGLSPRDFSEQGGSGNPSR